MTIAPVAALHTAAPWLFTHPLAAYPRMIQAGMQLYGTKEIEGDADSPVILSWARELVAAGIPGTTGYTHDSIPWCGLAQGKVALLADKHVPDQPYWALNWRGFGTPETIASAALGDTLVFVRTGGGHVGSYVYETPVYFGVLGGNEGDAYRIVPVAKASCVAVRRPPMTMPPATRRKVVLPAVSSPGSWSLA